VEDGVNGFLIDPFNLTEFVDKTEVLTNHSKYLNVLSENARKSSKKFSFDEIYKKWEVLFDTL
jgi:glycosyltransferase involved in cell wall biosynthesis